MSGPMRSWLLKVALFLWSCQVLMAQTAAEDLVNEGNAKMGRQDYEGAIADFTESIKIDPQQTRAYNNRANAKYFKGDLAQAMEDHAIAIAHNPNDHHSYESRARTRTKMGDADGAMADYDSSLKLNPKSTVAYSRRAGLRRDKGDLDGALADCSEFVKLLPNSTEGYKLRAEIYYFKNAWRDALKDYRRVAELHPNTDELIHVYIWVLRVSRGEKTEADKELDGYLDDHWSNGNYDWHAQAIRFVLDLISEEDLLATPSEPGVTSEATQRAALWYIAGIKKLFAGDKKGAAERFQKSVDTKAESAFAYRLSKSELQRLGKEKAGPHP